MKKNPLYLPGKRRVKGFTLIELIVVIVIIGILCGVVVFTLNPFSQLEKVHDAQRRHDLGEVKKALDTYYHDHDCYPSTVTFGGGTFEVDGVIYMKEVPQDPSIEKDSLSGYTYVTDTEQANDCPQWYILFSKLERLEENSEVACAIPDECMPTDGENRFCTYEGSINCDIARDADLETLATSQNGFTGGVGTSSTGGGSGGGTGPSSCPPGQTWACRGDSTDLRCNNINPDEVYPDDIIYCDSTCGGAC